jgi:hypothetical protein
MVSSEENRTLAFSYKERRSLSLRERVRARDFDRSLRCTSLGRLGSI